MSGAFATLKSQLAIALASAVCLVAALADAGQPCSCGREHFGPCTLGAAPYGYYPAQWRRWPTDESVVATAPPTWRNAAPNAPRLAPPVPPPAGKRSPDQLFEEEIPALSPRGPAAPPTAPKPMPRSDDPFKDDTTSSSPYIPHPAPATPAAAPRAPWTASPDDREANATPPGQFDPFAGRPRSMRSINPLDDDAGLQEPALVENKREVLPASRTAKPSKLEPSLADDDDEPTSGNPLRAVPGGASRGERRTKEVALDDTIDPEKEAARLESANEPQLLSATKASPLAEYAQPADNDEPAEKTAAPAPADGEPRLIEPAVDAQATDASADEPKVAERSEPVRWRESDVIRSGFSRSKSFRRPIATASEGSAANPLRSSSGGAANPLR